MKLSICLDVDGVLAQFTHWQGIEIIGPPISGAVEFTKKLSEFARIIIFTTRTKEYPIGIEAPHGATDPDRRPVNELVVIVKNWLDLYGFAYDEVYCGQGKPFAHAIIDDRAVSCQPQEIDPRWAFHQALLKVKELCHKAKPSDVSPILSSVLKGETSV